MRNFAQLSPTFWTRGLGRKLRGQPEALALAIYLSTAPAANMIGLYYLPLVSICHDLGLSEAAVRRELHVLQALEAVAYDFEAELVWVTEHVVDQLGEELKPGDLKRRGVERQLREAGDHRFVDAFQARYRASHGVLITSENVAAEAPSEAPFKGSYQYQSPAPSQDRGQVPDPRDRADVREALATFERLTGTTRPLAPPESDEGCRVLLALLDSGRPVSDVCRAFESVIGSDWWTKTDKSRGLSSLTVEVVSRELDKLAERQRAIDRRKPAQPRKANGPPLAGAEVLTFLAKVNRG